VRVNLMRFEQWDRSGAGFPVVEGGVVGGETWATGR
jgi:hypothetical protein